jgi:hypothetical protein
MKRLTRNEAVALILQAEAVQYEKKTKADLARILLAQTSDYLAELDDDALASQLESVLDSKVFIVGGSN